MYERHAAPVVRLAHIPYGRCFVGVDVALSGVVVAALPAGDQIAVDHQLGAAAGVVGAARNEIPLAAAVVDREQRDVVKHRVLLADLEFRIALEPYGQRVVTVCRQIRFVDVDGRNRFVRAGFQVGSREGVGAFGQRDVLGSTLYSAGTT